MRRIFIVEDDEDIRELTIYALQNAGFECHGFEDADSFFDTVENSPGMPELVILDIMLPGEDGLSILKRLKGNPKYKEIPVIMLTAKGTEADKVKGLNMGADDYVSKPFGVTELTARINAVLRRCGEKKPNDSVLTYMDIVQDPEKRTVTVDGVDVRLTFTEFELLRYMLLNTNIVLSRDKLMDRVWGYDYEGESRTVDMHIKALRRKLGHAGAYIKTVRNVGYKLGE